MSLENYLKNKSVKNLLVIRSAPEDIVLPILNTIKDHSSFKNIVLLAQENTLSQWKDSIFTDFIPLKNGFFKIGKDSRHLLKELREYNFDCIILPYNNSSGRTYFQWELFLFFTRISALGCHNIKKASSITFTRCLQSFLRDIVFEKCLLIVIKGLLFPLYSMLSVFEFFIQKFLVNPYENN